MSGTSVDRIIGTLISVVAHKGDASQGHFICYSKLDDSDVFYDNSDSRCAYQSNCHLFQSSDITETADLLVYKNKLCRILKMMTSNKV